MPPRATTSAADHHRLNSSAQRAAVVRLHAAGKGETAIAVLLGITAAAVRRILREERAA